MSLKQKNPGSVHALSGAKQENFRQFQFTPFIGCCQIPGVV